MQLFLFSILVPLAFSSELVKSNPSAKPRGEAAASVSSLASVELNDCKPQADEAAKKTEEEIAHVAAEKADLPKEEILARLIYSETLSTGYYKGKCQAPSDESMMEGIGWGVMKRVQAKKKSVLDPYAGAIFAKMQFRTSFSGKKKNDFAEAFLCPLRSDAYLANATVKVKAADLYKKAQATAKKIVQEYEQNGLPASYKKITNFFYPRSEFFGEIRPSWAKDPVANKNKGYVNILKVDADPCIEFYQL